MQSLPPFDATLDERLRLIVASYQRLTGKALIDNVPSEIAALRQAVCDAPRAIVAHGTETDPVFFYGNHLALQLFEMSFEEFARLPSRFSAEPLAREERAKLLDIVTRQGYVDNYSGMRIAKSGKRFMIENGTVWNLIDGQGIHQGQAAVFVAQKLK
jgi:hypothetical protein